MNKTLNLKLIIALLLLVLGASASSLMAQTSNGIFFQAIARDNASNPAKDRKIFIQTSIIQTSIAGNKVLTEEHSTMTDASGVFSISIGNGVRVGGSASNLANIDWSNGPFFLNLKIAITPVGSNSSWDYSKEWVDMGTTSFGSVPFAFYAENVAGLDQKLNIADSVNKYVTPAKLAAKTFDSTAIYNQLALKANSAVITTSLNTKENISNKSLDVNIDGSSDAKYPSAKAVKSYVDASIIAGTTPLSFISPLVKSGYTISLPLSNGSVNGFLSSVDWSKFNNKLDATEKGANNGVASLGNDGKIPSTQIPAISFQSASVVSSQTAMLAINGAVVGSIAIRTDNNKNYVLSASPSTTLTNWIELATPNSVSSVNGFAGPNVVLTSNDVSEGAANKYYTDARTRGALSATAPLIFNSNTGSFSISAASTSIDGYLTAVDWNTFNNKQNALIAGTDYVTPAQISLNSLGAEARSNKATATDLGNTNPSDVLYPSQKAVKTYVDLQNANAGVADNSITSAKINGTIAINKGGTGATTAADARTNLGLVIGANVQAPLTAGTDYLTPSGSAANLINFPIFNQNTTGNAATATLATNATNAISANNITATSNNTITALPNLVTIGTITSGVWSATNIDIAHGGTGSSTKDFVDLSTNQNAIGGTKTFSNNIVSNGVNIGKGSSVTTSSIIIGPWTNAGENSIAIGSGTMTGNSGAFNIAIGENALRDSGPVSKNTAVGFNAGSSATVGDNNTYLGYSTISNSGATISNSTAIGSGAKIYGSNTIRLGANGLDGTTAIDSVLTTGTLTTGAVTYPKTHGTANQVLSTTGSGTLTWTTVSSTADAATLSGTIAINKGGTGATSKSDAFNALSPMTTAGDIIYGGASGMGTRLAKGNDGEFLKLSSGVPVWGSPYSGIGSIDFTGANNRLNVYGNSLEMFGTNSLLLNPGTDGQVYIDTYADGSRVATRDYADTKAPINANLNDQIGTTYLLNASDNGKVITLNNASVITLTVPAGLAAGFNCMIVQKGTGIVTIAAANTVTVTNRSGGTKTGGQNAIVTLISISSNYFISGGDMQ